MFERMLFLTATPFHLVHNELLRVLERFEGVAWDPPLDRRRFTAQLADLRTALDATQSTALRLERAWGQLEPGDAVDAELPDEAPDRIRRAVAAIDQLRDAM